MTVNFMLNKINPSDPHQSNSTQIASRTDLVALPQRGDYVVLPKAPSGFGVYLVEESVWQLLAAPVISVYVMETLP